MIRSVGFWVWNLGVRERGGGGGLEKTATWTKKEKEYATDEVT